MYVETRLENEKKRYYLAHSLRIGKKIKKIRKYLGTDLSEMQLKKAKRKAEEKIHLEIQSYKTISDPLKTILSKKELNLIQDLEKKIDFKIHHLTEEDWKTFSETFTYNTNAIEGSTITEKEVKEIIEKNKWPTDKSKFDIAETYGVMEAITFMRKTKEHISLDLIKELHKIVFKNSKNFAGKIRPKGIEVGIADSNGTIIHRGAPSESIKSLLQELVKWYNEYKKEYPPLVLAAVVHNQFENIHPFQDGNGRVGRLILNNILTKHGLPPVNIDLEKRNQYYKTLQAYENENNLRPTIELLITEYKQLKKKLAKKKP